jgi:lysozyme
MPLDIACELAARFEGYAKALPDGRCTTYRCPAGVLTIGYGSTHGIKEGDIWTHEQAKAALRGEMIKAMGAAYRLCPQLPREPDGRQAAIADFIYNLGSGAFEKSTLRKKINAGDWQAVPTELRKWVNGGGRKLQGLVLRREAEIALI